MIQGPLIAVGNTAEVFAWGASHVLKLYRLGYPPNEAEREANLVQAVISAGVPTPPVSDLITVDGRAGIIFERVEGPSMLEMLMGGPTESSATFPGMLAKLQADLHTFSSAELPCLYTRLRNRVASDASGAQNVAALSPSTVAKIQGHLQSLSVGGTLCHGDFGPQNVLLTEEGPVIIDWVDAARGRPAADVARTVVIMKYAVLPPTIDEAVREQFEEFRQGFVQEYLAQYHKLAGVTWDEVSRWIVPVAAARLNHEQSSEEEKHRLADVVRTGLSS